METHLQHLSGIKGFKDLDGPQQVEAIVYALTDINGDEGVQPAAIKETFERLHVATYSRISQYLSEKSRREKSRKPRFLKGPKGYRLEASAKEETRLLFPSRPTKLMVAKHLSDLVAKLPTPESRSYLEEAIGCFMQEFFRAAVVMTWCLTYDLLRTWIFTRHLAALNAKFSARPKNPLTIISLDDFESLGEKDVLNTAKAAGILGKELEKTFAQLLDDRNSYAHPSGKVITPSIAEAYIEKAVLQAIEKLK